MGAKNVNCLFLSVFGVFVILGMLVYRRSSVVATSLVKVLPLVSRLLFCLYCLFDGL